MSSSSDIPASGERSAISEYVKSMERTLRNPARGAMFSFFTPLTASLVTFERSANGASVVSCVSDTLTSVAPGNWAIAAATVASSTLLK